MLRLRSERGNTTIVTYAVVAVQAADGQTLSRVADEELRNPIHRKDVFDLVPKIM